MSSPVPPGTPQEQGEEDGVAVEGTEGSVMG